MTRGRPLAFTPDEATSAAMQVFWARGYDNASTRDLLEAMQISRSSLYQTYGNKEQLFIEALRRYREGLLDRLKRRLANAPSARFFLETLFLDTAREAGSDRAALGCLIFNSASELGQRDETCAVAARSSVAAVTALFQEAILRGQAEGDIDPARDAETLAHYLTLSMAGLRTLLKAGAERQQAECATALVLETLGLTRA